MPGKAVRARYAVGPIVSLAFGAACWLLLAIVVAAFLYLSRGVYNPADALVLIAIPLVTMFALGFGVCAVIACIVGLIECGRVDPRTGLRPRGQWMGIVGLVLGATPIVALSIPAIIFPIHH